MNIAQGSFFLKGFASSNPAFDKYIKKIRVLFYYFISF